MPRMKATARHASEPARGVWVYESNPNNGSG